MSLPSHLLHRQLLFFFFVFFFPLRIRFACTRTSCRWCHTECILVKVFFIQHYVLWIYSCYLIYQFYIFLLLSIPLYEHTTNFFLSIHQQHLICSSFWVSYIKLPLTILYQQIFMDIYFYFSWVKPRSEISGSFLNFTYKNK